MTMNSRCDCMCFDFLNFSFEFNILQMLRVEIKFFDVNFFYLFDLSLFRRIVHKFWKSFIVAMSKTLKLLKSKHRIFYFVSQFFSFVYRISNTIQFISLHFQKKNFTIVDFKMIYTIFCFVFDLNFKKFFSSIKLRKSKNVTT